MLWLRFLEINNIQGVMYIMFVRLQLKINRLLLVLYKYNRRIAMRGIDTQTKKIREQVFEEVARAAYSTEM